MRVTPDGLGKRCQLIGIRAQCGDEKEMGFVSAKGLQKIRLAHTAAAIEYEQLCTARSVALLELCQLPLAVDEHARCLLWLIYKSRLL
jgi:hypothetical protein